ncbi:MAG: 50S ribosomal protein L10 [Elusimicrobia bacterium]|nr:50S ribosomal protein L10 [Elusimicrobiota bacterium]
MPSVRKDREDAVAKLTKDFDGLQGLVVAGYVGVKTQELNELRGKLRPHQARCQIVKNRLAKIALQNKGISVGFADFFKGQSALIIQKGDAVAGLKVLVEFEKTHANMKIRAAYLDGKVVKGGDLKTIASLPTRNVLLAQLLGQFQGPLTGFARLLQADLRNLAVLLNQVAKKMEKGGAA